MDGILSLIEGENPDKASQLTHVVQAWLTPQRPGELIVVRCGTLCLSSLFCVIVIFVLCNCSIDCLRFFATTLTHSTTLTPSTTLTHSITLTHATTLSLKSLNTITGFSFAGRYVPEQELVNAEFDSKLSHAGKHSFEEWLREVTTLIVNTEIQPLTAMFLKNEDFIAVFEKVTGEWESYEHDLRFDPVIPSFNPPFQPSY